MKTFFRALIAVLVVALITPVLAFAQTTGSSTVDAQVQSLLSQITALEAQLHSLVQSVAPSSTTPPMWNASSTPNANPGQGQGQSQGMGNCPSFGRDLSMGSQGSDVMQLQQFLQGQGMFSASTTGFFGQLTANALDQFQMHFGISTSSAGFLGPLTRAFIGQHCGGQGGAMRSATSTSPMMMWQGTSTPPMRQGGQGGPQGMSSSTRPGPSPFGQNGSSTAPSPCPQNASQGATAGLFMPHVVLPMFMQNPCGAPAQPQSSQ